MSNPHIPPIELMATPGVPIKYWHVYQEKNGLWTVVSEGEDGHLATRMSAVGSRHEALDDARKYKENTGEGTILVEYKRYPNSDGENLDGASMKPRRVHKSRLAKTHE